MKLINKLTRKGVIAIASTAVAFAFITAGMATLAQGTAYAASCDKVNIVHCGLEGSSLSGYISSLKSMYNKNSDNGHNDLRAIYNWAGLSSTEISGMSSANTKLGTLYRNGDIKVDGKVVATDSWVSARFTSGDGFVKISDGVWARKTTTSFANASAPVLVHYLADGTVDSAVMIDCGNAIKVTPVKPTPKPAMACSNLTATAVANKQRSYTFAARATASNTTITDYVFSFGDGKSVTVKSGATTASITHTYAQNGTKYIATVTVNGTDIKGATGTQCSVTFTTPKADECKPGVPVGDEKCKTPPTPVAPTTPAAPTELPQTGPSAIAGLFAGTSAFGAVAHSVIRRRLSRS